MDTAMRATVGGLVRPAEQLEQLPDTVTVGAILESFTAWVAPNETVAAAAAARGGGGRDD